MMRQIDIGGFTMFYIHQFKRGKHEITLSSSALKAIKLKQKLLDEGWEVIIKTQYIPNSRLLDA